MNRNPLVTVFIAAYNCERYIQQTVDSILSQTYKNIEIIIIDDGSSDNTVNIIKAIKDEKIRFYQNEKNKGIPFTRNLGLELAKGEYIAIIDADDVAFPNRLKKQLNYLLNNTEIDVLGTYYKTIGNRFPRTIKTKFVCDKDIKAFLIFYNNIANPTVMMRKGFLVENSLQYDERYFVAQDYKLWSEVVKYGNISIVKEPLTRYRVGHGNITQQSKKSEEKAKRRKSLIDRIHIDLLNHYGFDLSQEEIEQFNLFFTDNIVDDYKINEQILYQMIKNIYNQNNRKKIFNSLRFREILSHCVLISLDRHNLKFSERMKLWKEISSIIKVNKLKGDLEIFINSLIKIMKRKI